MERAQPERVGGAAMAPAIALQAPARRETGQASDAPRARDPMGAFVETRCHRGDTRRNGIGGHVLSVAGTQPEVGAPSNYDIWDSILRHGLSLRHSTKL